VALAQGDLIPTDPSADWSAVNLYNLAGPKTWPITMISYFYLEKDLSGMDAKTAALLMAFVKFVLSEEGQAKAEDKLFVKLPAAMQTYNTATLASLTLPAGYAALSVELASNTLIEVGAGVNVLSGKRREYGEWDRDRMEAQFEEQQKVVGVQMLHGAGTTNPSKLFWELLGLMTARAKFAVHATYRAVGSSTGQKEFLGASNGNVALNHFGSGDIPMTADRYSAVAAAGRTMVHVPFAVGGIGVFHSAPVGGATVDLTACVLAKIFSAQITMWDDAEIAALNAGVTLPSLPIKVVHRVKGSSSTAGFTAYMLETCPASWTLGTGSTITWPAGTNEGQGSDGMSQFIEDNEGA
jgi:ABC-type phosphate transport system substrate-binding protein